MVNNRILFTGREWVPRHGFYEYRARAYHPKLGRFMSEDPIGFSAGDSNLFRYCAGDPVNKTDPTGLVPYQNDQSGVATTGRVVVTGSFETAGSAGFGPTNVSFNIGGRGTGGAHIGAGSLGPGARITGGTAAGIHGDGNGRQGRIVSATYGTDTNQLGTTPWQPYSSLQGWWTTPEGFPTGSSLVINLLVQSAIEKGWQAGMKTIQSLTFNSWGQIVSHWASIGVSNVINVHGWGTFSATVSSAGNRYLVNMAGSSLTAVSALVPGIAPIDYSFSFRGTFGVGQPTLSGAHDGYPSYSVWANGQSIYYRQETGGLRALRNPMEIVVGQ
jgi:RHS repeat-associated protein